MNYTKRFDPSLTPAFTDVYVYTPEIILAVNVALATGRPLLISGPSGCGKSTLARSVAGSLGWEFLSEVVTSRTEAVDLLFRVDNLRQLRDTHTGLMPRAAYVEPGVLWRAFDPIGSVTKTATVPHPLPVPGAVVLLDEIDKADPDVPNNLLEPFGDYSFKVPELDDIVVTAQRKPLLIITTNNERRLPDAFIRRCVDLKIDRPKAPELSAIARAHFAYGPAASPSDELLKTVAEAVVKTESYSTAEYLDTIRAIVELQIPETSDNFTEIIGLTVRKTARQVPQ